MRHLVVDASAVINLLALTDPHGFLETGDLGLLLPKRVRHEITRCPRNEHVHAPFARLDVSKRVEILQIDDDPKMVELFMALVSGELGQSIDDGEAASIALASHYESPLVLDDQKARRLCEEHFADVELVFTIELFRELAVRDSRTASTRPLLFDALRYGRMRVPREGDFLDWIFEQLSDDELLECSSVPSRST